MDLTERQIESEAIYDGCLLHIRRDTVSLPDGRSAVREYNRHLGAVCVLPLTDDGRVLLERQFRYPIGETVTEIPAGKLDAPDEDPLTAAKRELREETGAEAREWFDLGLFYAAPAYSTEVIHMYAAKGLTFGSDDPDEDEFLEVFLLPLEEAAENAISGAYPDAKTQAAVLRADAMRRRGLL